ncbi:hypothetical protein [Natranaerobius thermophilus]|uniref:Uncharacterized protein n=1 Tax=Natranaerobius thermophilus (strain ATCC BAA-1301 / DSM 18059 / JW/NM-WN-LF) TaxID=457570 RepID=B2A210_NATTJ|nr:hypothetical protein [Natranaerobius thermophilus]ACB84815.1 hypothetical protein Nther_1232 [Natranaerobius thermophilus JW/NM-WN-LF]
MSDYLKIKFAETDEEVSQEGEFDNAIIFKLKADEEEKDSERLYIEADEDYHLEDVVIKIEGDTAEKWALAPDDDGEEGEYKDWGESLDLGDIDAEDTKHFWVKAKAEENEDLGQYDDVLITVEGLAEETGGDLW